MKKSCMKKQATVSAQQESISINVQSNSPERHVRFASKLDNDYELSAESRERIEHNLKYNDDTIFDNISIFRDLNNSGVQLLSHHKMIDKEVHPRSLLGKPVPIEGDSDDAGEVVFVKMDTANPVMGVDREEEKEEFKEEKLAEDEKRENDQFWREKKQSVSPIARKEKGNMSQELSKDLIELDNDQSLKKLQFQDESNNNSDLRIGEKIGENKQQKKKNQFVIDEKLNKEDSLQLSEQKQQDHSSSEAKEAQDTSG